MNDPAQPTDGSAPGGVSVPPPLSAHRRAVLFSVRRLGDARVEQVADTLDITISGARQHLTSLVDFGFLGAEEIPRATGEPGRPQLAYHVTELADALFPKAYAALTTELLGYLDDDDPDTITRLFDRRKSTRITNAERRLAPKRSLTSRVDELAAILDDDGYVATAEHFGRGRHRIVEHNCAISAVAKRYGQACGSEIEFIRAVLPDTTVERVQHMISGDRHCAYEVTAQ